MNVSLLLVTSERFVEHTPPPGHPERPARAEVMDAVAARFRTGGGSVAEPRAATYGDLLRVHKASYVEEIAATSGHAVMLDHDTYTSPESYEIALLAAGAALTAVDHAIDTGGQAFALVRPPGHHAGRDRAMGFCIFNNVAASAAYAITRGIGRVAIVDFDVHHGNGTQSMFYARSDVLYVSIHQHPYYPGTGAADEIGREDGGGFTVNIPLEAGSTDADYNLVFNRIVVPVLMEFSPDLILVSAGYDAHECDPMAGMRVTTDGFGLIVSHLAAVARESCGGRLALVTEGGYDLKQFAACLESSIDILCGRGAPGIHPSPDDATTLARIAVDRICAVQKRYWTGV